MSRTEGYIRVKYSWVLGLSVIAPVILVACDSNSDSTSGTTDTTTTSIPVDPSLFLNAGLSRDISTERCTLSSGVETTCYSITIVGNPVNDGADIGPFCPSNTSDTAESVGIWFDGTGALYDLTGSFIENLATTYNDPNWVLHDQATGDVYVTDTQAACEGAAQPNVEEAYKYKCVVCDIAYYDGGIELTFQIPVTPVPLEEPAALSGDTGVALNGVVMALSASVDDILSNYTIAAFDDCGGHVNPNEGYHYHAATGCSEVVDQPDEHAPMIGYARDGYGIYAMTNAAGEEHTDLDQCRGANDDIRGYHYHAASAAENMFIGCFHGDTVAVATGQGGGPGGGPPPE